MPSTLPTLSPTPRDPLALPSALLASFAIGVPMLLAFNLPPSSTALNQCAALIGWGAWLVLLTGQGNARLRVPGATGLACLQAALALVLAAALVSPLWTALPWSLSLSSAGMIGAAMLAVQVGAVAANGGLDWPLQPLQPLHSVTTVASRAPAGRGTAVRGSVPTSPAISPAASVGVGATDALGLDAGARVFKAFCIGLVAAGVLSSVVGLVQVFAPSWADGTWIARSYIDGRAVGNMRQPNHLSSLLLWAIVAVVWLGEVRVLQRVGAQALAALFVLVVVLTASRTGALSMLLLAAWGAFDRRLSRSARGLLIAAPLVYALFWFATGAWADATHHVFGGETRFTTQGDISSSRWGIWANTLQLIAMHPWVGVGFGDFNFAWTLTPFPGRPVAFFDHTHDLVLQFLVELGIPLGSAVVALMAAAVWFGLRSAWRAARAASTGAGPSSSSTLRQAAFMMVLLILLHSLLEYPLWYAYFLLPAAFAFGICLGSPTGDGDGVAAATATSAAAVAGSARHGASAQQAVVGRGASGSSAARASAAQAPTARAPTAQAPSGRPLSGRVLTVGAVALLAVGMLVVADYLRVVVIFAPPANATPLAQRIAEGRHSIFFAHHADYADATTATHPADVLPAFRAASHFLLDGRLLQAWAIALNEAGETDRARYVAQRLREFHKAGSADFFAPCEAPPAAGKPLPFQCLAPTRALRYEDFE